MFAVVSISIPGRAQSTNQQPSSVICGRVTTVFKVAGSEERNGLLGQAKETAQKLCRVVPYTSSDKGVGAKDPL